MRHRNPEPTHTMKPPHVSSAVPSLLDVDPMAPFEFSFTTTTDDFWWDDADTSDYFSSDSDPEPYEDQNNSFPSMFYHISPSAPAHSEAETIPTKEGDEICRRSPREDDYFVSKLTSTIAKAAPKNVYKRRKLAMRRKIKRKKRKKMTAVQIETDFQCLWLNVGDLFALSPVTKPDPHPSLPSVNLHEVNRTMLRRLPEVVEAPIHSVSESPTFYTKVVCQHYASKFVSTPKPLTQHQKENPFGTLPAIETDAGNVPPPNESFHGYVWSDGKWRVRATRPQCGGEHGRLHQQGRGRQGEG